mmetsp:Transcript_80983/g.158245  ORF Transcript_80983/g.158245 Transcript_80983/m.158245 type:complete len:119 (+) Transcript_80983:123-479(+)
MGGISEARLYSEDSHLNSDSTLHIEGTMVACEVVRDLAAQIVEIAERNLKNGSRQHHTGSIVNGRALKVKDAHSELPQRNRQHMTSGQRAANRQREAATEQQAKWKEGEKKKQQEEQM